MTTAEWIMQNENGLGFISFFLLLLGFILYLVGAKKNNSEIIIYALPSFWAGMIILVMINVAQTM